MAKFNLEDYEPVEERIRRFYQDHPEGRIHADLISDANNIAVAVVKAQIYVGDNLVSTGLAYEKNGEGYVNKTSHLENCETSAIGRALANYNYAGSKRPSREEMQKTGGNGKKQETPEPSEEWKVLRQEAIGLLKSDVFANEPYQSNFRDKFKAEHHNWTTQQLQDFLNKATIASQQKEPAKEEIF